MEETPHTRPGPSGDRLLELLAPVHGELRALARRIARSPDDGDDLFQEAAIRALRKIGDLRDDDRFRGWFTRILLSVHRSRSRRAFWRRFVSLDAAEPGFEPRVQPPAPGNSARAFRALATLPAVQREAVVLFDLEGRGVDEIAALQKFTSCCPAHPPLRGPELRSTSAAFPHKSRKRHNNSLRATRSGQRAPPSPRPLPEHLARPPEATAYSTSARQPRSSFLPADDDLPPWPHRIHRWRARPRVIAEPEDRA